MRYTQEHYKQAWEMFISAGEQNIIEDNFITSSWKRSRSQGLDPNDDFTEGNRMKPDELRILLTSNENLLRLAKPYIDLVYSTIKNSDVVISLANHDANLLYVVGDAGMSDAATRNNIVPGAARIEEKVGTNAVGLAIYHKQQVQIRGYQHYNKHFHKWACSASPIMDDADNIFGVVTITCGIRSANLHTLSLARSLAEIITATKRLEDKNYELIKINSFLDQVMQKFHQGVLILDSDRNIISCNDYAVSVMGKELLQYVGRQISELFLAPLPEFFHSKERTSLDVMLKTRVRNLRCAVEFNPIYASDKRLVGYILFFYEVSKRNMDAHKIVGNRVYYHFDDLIGKDKGFLDMIGQAKIAATSNTRVLIQGESGTGKELFAQSIHNESKRRGGPFVPINCAAIPGELIESELFGYAPGSFTGAAKDGRPGRLEVANRGTVFFDEIGDMPWDMQTKLLRVLQDNYVVRIGSSEEIFLDVRYIFATNVDLETKVALGEFRKDLFYRINVFTLRLPPLRERTEDIPLLALSLAEKLAKRLEVPACSFHKTVMDLLVAYFWPGNIRQLENVIERLTLLAQGGEVTPEYLPEALRPAGDTIPGGAGRLVRAQKQAIEETLKQTGGNIAAAAKLLGISRKTLYAKLKEYQMSH